MPDREKVIKAVEEAFDLVHSDFIGTDDFNEAEWEQNKTDALALLKKHIPVAYEMEGDGRTPFWYWVCGECHGQIDSNDHYCRHCGQAIKNN